MYDYPSPPSTASSSRFKSITHLPSQLSPLASSTPMSHQRATKESDMAHLLDPSYSPSRATYLNQIYVDHTGEAHDPDFRLFAPASYSPKRREFLTCESDDDDDAADDADDYEGVDIYAPRRASFDSARSTHSHTITRPTSRSSDPTTHHSPYGAFTYTFEELGYLSDDEPRREVNKLRRRRTSLEHDLPCEQSDSVPMEEQRHRAAWPTSVPFSFFSHSRWD